MRSKKIIVCIMLYIVVLGIQGVYLVTSYRQDKAYITTSKNQIHFIENRIQKLGGGTSNLVEIKEELEALTTQNRALLNTIPTFTSGSKETADLLRSMYANNFKNIRLAAITENDTITSQDSFISSRTYELNFIGCYEEVRDLVDSINQSYQMIHIESLELSNKVQDLGNEQNFSLYEAFGEDFYKILQVTLKLTLHGRQSELEDEEHYQADMDLRVHSEGVFSLHLNTQQEDESEVQQGPTKEREDLFTLNIGDFLTSGDTYKFGGPGEGEGGYVGLSSESDVKIQLILKENEYEMMIEDADGKKEQITIQAVVTHPQMHIISTMRAIYDTMPHISIFIDNRTSQLLSVDIEGELTENIKVFNESGYLLTRGEIKGTIKLT